MDPTLVLSSFIDALLALILVIFAWQALHARTLFTSIIYFISFGLLMSLVWLRLNAPDVALAEAAIGAGLSGALFLQALSRLPLQSENSNQQPPVYVKTMAFIACLAIAIGLGFVLFHFEQQHSLIYAVSEQMHLSGVGNPVTAVLLNFRGYDTMLEVMVLLVAALGIRTLSDIQLCDIPASQVLISLSRLLIPMLVMVSGYLLWAGADHPGGAFQAGSILAAAGVLLILSGWKIHSLANSLTVRLLLVFGPLIFITIGLYTLSINGQLLQMHNEQASRLILILETVATVSIALTLIVLFAANASRCEPSEEHSE